ncbi:MAG: hypothetical protein LAT67_04250 [Balneolales bacterium]|nr:hypothetical protein [Balneolales bacterium]
MEQKQKSIYIRLLLFAIFEIIFGALQNSLLLTRLTRMRYLMLELTAKRQKRIF